MSSESSSSLSRSGDPSRVVSVGLIGCGTVGTGVLQLLSDNAETIKERLGAEIEIVGIAVKDPDKVRDPLVDRKLLTPDADSVVDHPKAQVIVEVVGGIESSKRIVTRALSAGRHVVTANKALIAHAGPELLALAESNGVDLFFEAAVAGGIPIIRVLREALASDRILSLSGILNGTSNYILSRMTSEGLSFEEALLEAQSAGYAEADPTLDVGGGDAQQKLAIVAALALGARVHPDRISVEGIDTVSAVDIEYASRFGFVVKPLAIAGRHEDGLDLRVHPTLVPKGSVLASISGAQNAVYLEGAMLGPCLLTGPGAGALPTAMSVVSDIVDVGRNILVGAHGRVPSRVVGGVDHAPALRDAADYFGRFYLRFTAADQHGVLADLTRILGERRISIQRMVQDNHVGSDGLASIVMLTHGVRGGDVRAALSEIDELPTIRGSSCAIRIEERARPR